MPTSKPPSKHPRTTNRKGSPSAIESMRAEGVLRVELTLEADNQRALAFYLKRGFEQEGRLRKAYKRAGEPGYLDELVMSRWLG